jgi:hypothetical protein
MKVRTLSVHPEKLLAVIESLLSLNQEIVKINKSIADTICMVEHVDESKHNAKGNQRRPLNYPRLAQRCFPPSG